MEHNGNSEVETKPNVQSKRNYRKIKRPTAKKRSKMMQPKLPKCASEVSSNWKALSAVLATQAKTKDNKRKKTEDKFSMSKKMKLNTNVILKGKHFKNEKTGNEIWFDDVDPEDIEKVTGKKFKISDGNIVPVQNSDNHGNLEELAPRSTKYVAMDCEFVGVGRDGEEHMLARISVVNSDGEVLYDQFVAAQERVIDYRTEISGVRPSDLKNAPKFADVQKDIAALIKSKILVGHSITTDLKVLFLDHPRKHIRDTAKYKPFQERMRTKHPSLKKLAKEVLSLSIQTGEHSSVEDSRATMQLYREHRKEWEKSIKDRFKTNKRKPENNTS